MGLGLQPRGGPFGGPEGRACRRALPPHAHSDVVLLERESRPRRRLGAEAFGGRLPQAAHTGRRDEVGELEELEDRLEVVEALEDELVAARRRVDAEHVDELARREVDRVRHLRVHLGDERAEVEAAQEEVEKETRRRRRETRRKWTLTRQRQQQQQTTNEL